MSNEFKLEINGTEYEFYILSGFAAPANTPIIIFENKTYYGKAIPKQASKLPVKDWEILLGRNKHGAIHDWLPDNSHGGDSCVERGCEIHSVRRLSDSEVFIVDEVTEQGKIISFSYSQETDLHVFVNTGNMSYNYPYRISEISKLKQAVKLSEGCNICGGELVMIRAKYPGCEKRKVCPTCNTERLEQINELSSKTYGVACSVNVEPLIPPLKP